MSAIRLDHSSIGTAWSYDTEVEACVDLDRVLADCGMFTVYTEVRGHLLQSRAGQEIKTMRVDRLLTPTGAAIDAGWSLGAIAIEVKRDAATAGRAIAQAMDYSRSVWDIGRGGVLIHSPFVFLWPFEKVSGPMASLMAHQRIGTAQPERWTGGLKLSCGENVVADLMPGGFVIRAGALSFGRKAGSR